MVIFSAVDVNTLKGAIESGSKGLNGLNKLLWHLSMTTLMNQCQRVRQENTTVATVLIELDMGHGNNSNSDSPFPDDDDDLPF